MPAYVEFIGQNNDPAAPAGGLVADANWAGGVMPAGSSTGLVYTTGASVWAGIHQNLAVRQTGGYVVGSGGNMTMRGGTSGSGIATIYEIEDARADFASYTNLYVGDTLTFWSQFGENMELSLLSGHVEVGNLAWNARTTGTLNMRDGILHAGSMGSGQGSVNMLAGGTGDITVDSLDASLTGNLFLNFETGNGGSFTFGEKTGGVSTGGTWVFLVGNGQVSIDGVVETDLAKFDITGTGLSDTIALLP